MSEHMTPAERGMRALREGGYKQHKSGDIHADAAQDAKQISSGVHQHEANMHAGRKPTKLKLKSGGEVKGAASKHRMDRRARGGYIASEQPDDAQGNDRADSSRARGGHVGKKGGNKTVINIIAGGGEKPPMPPPMPPHPPMMAGPPPGAGMPPGGAPPPGAMPPRPMMPPPGAGGPPPGMPPGMPPRARGGRLC